MIDLHEYGDALERVEAMTAQIERDLPESVLNERIRIWPTIIEPPALADLQFDEHGNVIGHEIAPTTPEAMPGDSPGEPPACEDAS